MPNIKFVLKEPKVKKKESLVYLIVRFNYQTLKLSTREKILPKLWGKSTQRAKVLRDYPEHSELNTRLDQLQASMKESLWNLTNNGIAYTKLTVKNKFMELAGFETISGKMTLFEFIDNFIEKRKVTVRPNTIKKYKATKQHLVNYCVHKGIKSLDFEEINLDFYYDFLKYMNMELSFATNTMGKYISTLKVFLHEATEMGLNDKMDFQSKRFAKPSEEVDKIYLNETELSKIYDLNLSDDLKLDKVRDLFIMECYLGQRFSDMEQLGPNNIKTEEGKKYITLRTIKTKDKVSIPLHPRVIEILEKYDNNFPKTITNQKTNKYLKDIGELAKLNDPINTSKNKKGLTVHKDKAKWELITTHTARRSFATNSYLAGVPVLSIMKMTGHKTEKSFLGYIQMTAEENAIKLFEYDFFKEKKKEVKVVNLN